MKFVLKSMPNEVQRTWAGMTNKQGGGYGDWIQEIVERIFNILPYLQRQTVYLDSTRYITDGSEILHASKVR
jgi:hypothetical protein